MTALPNVSRSFCDFHLHTLRSDGVLTPKALFSLLGRSGVAHFAVTDHDRPYPMEHDLRHSGLISGCEFFSSLRLQDGTRVLPHIVGLGFDPRHPAVQAVSRRNLAVDLTPYLQAMLDRLAPLGCVLTLEEIRSDHKPRDFLGRSEVAKAMVRSGFRPTVAEARALLSHDGQAFVSKADVLTFTPMAEVIAAIRSAGGIAVLAHPFYYRLTDGQLSELVHIFRASADAAGAMECHVPKYTPAQEESLLLLAGACGLAVSGGSDYHGLYGDQAPMQGDASLYDGLNARCRSLYHRDLDFFAR